MLGDDLRGDEHRSGLDEDTVKSISLALINGLVALHDNEIVHRDIKPHNILRCDDVWKIADFGISKRISKPVTGYTFQGAHTAPWAPPEQIAGKPADPSADIYSVGQVIAFLLTGKVKDNIQSVPRNWRDVVQRCIAYDPAKRPDIKQLREEIEGM